MSRSLALEVGPSEITVNVIAPGVIQTPGLDQFRSDAPEAFDQFMRSVPMKRPGSADDIASLVAFLSSDGGGYITGQTIFVCGGWSIGGPAW
jgi:3-oxoacyl-[acyl-carrier protein] reductase